jgi:uncharacterized protein
MAEQNLYLYRIQLTRLGMLTEGRTEAEDITYKQHVAYLQKLTDEGTALLVGRTLNADETTFGICIFRAESDEAADAIMNNDPGVHGGVWKATLFPFRIAFLGDFTGIE